MNHQELMLGFLACLGLVVLIGLLYGKMLVEYISESRKRKKSREFEEAISGTGNPETARKYFSGETKLQKTIYVVMPVEFEEDEFVEKFFSPIIAELEARNLGMVDRVYKLDAECGFDLSLDDFVQGLELAVAILKENGAPASTVIEYDDIELSLYD